LTNPQKKKAPQDLLSGGLVGGGKKLKMSNGDQKSKNQKRMGNAKGH